jgi:hypothetical protein
MHNYRDSHGHFPAGTIANSDLRPEKRLSWLVELGPYIEATDFFKRIDLSKSWDAKANDAPALTAHPVFICRASGQVSKSTSSYVGMAGVGMDAATLPRGDRRCGFFGYDRRITQEDVKDGLAQTVFVLETTLDKGPWTAGGPATVRGLDPGEQAYIGKDGPFGLVHRDPKFWEVTRLPAEANAGFADGSVRFLPDTVRPEVLQALVTIAGGEEIHPDEYGGP